LSRQRSATDGSVDANRELVPDTAVEQHNVEAFIAAASRAWTVTNAGER
jgi:hypothetical protein